MPDYNKKFIALDLETTHLDIREGRIMEVGAVESELFFDDQTQTLKVRFGKKITCLVNPEIEPSPTALMLTGISQEELTSASSWQEVKPKFQKFLANHILIGHNIIFDLEFLKQQGLALKNPYLDTLEIAQTLLPLLESHSLEFLASEFGSSVSGAHRALPDSQNSAQVLAGILTQVLSYPQALQNKIRNLFAKSQISFASLILDLPSTSLGRPRESSGEKNFQVPTLAHPVVQIFKTFPDKTLLLAPLGFTTQQELLQFLSKTSKSSIIGVSHPVYLTFLPEKQRLVSPNLALCEKRFQRLEAREFLPDLILKILIKIKIFRFFRKSFDLSSLKMPPLERSFLPKVLVEEELCPKHECGYLKALQLDLKQGYFGDLSSLFKLLHPWRINFTKFRLLLFDLGRIQDEFSESLEESWNLKKIRTSLDIIYPLEENLGWYEHLPREVEELANELDLFFGILHLIYLKREGEFSQNLVVDQVERQSERFLKLFHPSQKLLEKLQDFQKYLAREIDLKEGELLVELEALQTKIKKLIKFFKEFFRQPEAEKIYWLEFDARQVTLHSVTKQKKLHWQKLEDKFQSLCILDTELPKQALNYFQKQLDLKDWQIQKLSIAKPGTKIPVRIFSQSLSQEKLREFLDSLSGRSLIILPNEKQLEEIYKQLLGSKSSRRNIFAYKLSGSLGNIQSKLSSKSSFLFLLTNRALRFFPIFPRVENLVISRLPFEALGGVPMASEQVHDNFLDHILPRAVILLHRIFCLFTATGGENKQIYILDPRILTDYNQEFLKYLHEFPDFQISTINPIRKL